MKAFTGPSGKPLPTFYSKNSGIGGLTEEAVSIKSHWQG